MTVIASYASVTTANGGAKEADTRAARRARLERWRRQRCTNCTVKGQEYQGHSRFRYDEGCFRYRCICRCNGSWQCPAKHTINLCERREAAKRRSRNRMRSRNGNGASRNSRNQQRNRQCQTCNVNGKEYPGHAYFRHVDGCTTYERCICYCNGSWVCPASRARKTCEDSTPTTPTTTTKITTTPTTTTKTTTTPTTTTTTTTTTETSATTTSSSAATTFTNITTTRPESRIMTTARAESSEKENTTNSSNVSNGSRRRRQYGRCQNCKAFGKTFRGNRYFHAQQGCTNYTRCLCKCDGSWNCSQRFARNICINHRSSSASTTNRSCNSCSVQGKTFAGGRNFTHTDGCVEYKGCKCNCNGSWSCPGSQARNICTDNRRRITASGNATDVPSGRKGFCRECVAMGKTFTPNSYFDLKDKCMEYNNCICHCNGSWVCPPSHARNVCREDEPKQDKGCKECQVYGQKFEGGKNFTISRSCWKFTDCTCRCNGSWVCPPLSRRNLCNNEREDNETKSTSRRVESGGSTATHSGCRTCQVYGKNFTNQYFNVTNGCIMYKRCICKCDGSWQCMGEHATNICNVKRNTTTTSPERKCSVCNAKGKTVPGGTEFEITDGCYHYTSCSCACDGSWNCPTENGRDICSTDGDSRDGSGCMMCKTTDGRFHRPNRPFQFIDDCIERNCDCFCNGSWSCPGDRSRWICTDRCRGCEVEGKQVRNDTVFKHKTGCLEYTCNCHCNGSWSCPGETVRNTCPVGVRNNCNKCQISTDEAYPGESDFVLKQGCLHYKCRCNCDGSYSCPAEDSRNVCYGEKLGGCRSCVVSENEIYQGESDFNLRRECIASECRCYCNGTWQCPVEKNRNVCIGEALGGCKVCQVDGNETFRGNTDFDLRKGCLHYQCRCNCDGSWNCPGEKVRNVCKGEVPGGCRSCVISDDEFYPGNSNFEMVKNCIHYKCRCSCDGSYSCPGDRARRVCVKGPDGKERAVTQRPRKPQCRQCRVTERERFEGNTQFSRTEGCFKYSCSCKCDGSWECPAETRTNICTNGGGRYIRRNSVTQKPRQRQCRSCRAASREYAGNSSFSFTKGCNKFMCSCHCDGSWECPADKTINICRRDDGREAVTQRTRQMQCQRCHISGKEYAGNSSFSFTRGCNKFRCFCQCDGSWQCPTERIIDVCGGTDSGSVTQKPRETQCRRCRVSDQQQFEGNTVFSLEQGCYKFMCSCRCNGSWECPAEKVVNICSGSNSRSRNIGTPSSSCKACRRDGREYVAGSNYKITRGCQQFDCACLCDGSSNCDLNNPTNICSKRRDQRGRGNTRQRTRFNGRRRDYSERKDRCRPCNVIGQQVSNGQEFHLERGCTRYTNCQCRCNGHWQCAQREKICSEGERSSHGRTVVKKFEGTSSISLLPSTSQGTFNRQNNEDRVEPEEKESSAWVHVDGNDSSFVKIKDEDRTGGGYKIEVQTKYAPTFKYEMGRRAGQLKENKTSRTYTASGSTPSKDRFIQHEVEAAESPKTSRPGISRCSKCIADEKQYPSGAHFDMRRGCVVYKCACLCSGSYRCHITSDNACTDEKQQATCRNCMYNGLIFPGNMGFTFREGCIERQCSCHCNGSHTCATSKPLPGCSASSPATAGQHRVGSFYPVQRSVPVSVGYARRTGNPVYTHCPSCGLGTPVVYHTPVKRAHESKDHTTVERVDHDNDKTDCGGCEVEGIYRAGGKTFTFQKDCIEFDCYCSCGGSWKCAGRPLNCTPSTEVAPRSRDQPTRSEMPERLTSDSEEIETRRDAVPRESFTSIKRRHHVRSAPAIAPKDLVRKVGSNLRSDHHKSSFAKRCKDCYVNGKYIQSGSSFVRRVGCLETVCQCDCSGEHVCSDSDTVNVCEIEESQPMSERKGCKVGNKVFLTREFPLVENCIQRTCMCHDDGTYTCRRTRDDIQVC
ncbi:hypothetical protein ElyMa_000485900 [Elysia marginata]|uniref:Uncharacterized protein n=1 Tax=Elysia marginata TaxID=1093978 RepID=A0AAV4FW63_9GAST|nr:hypothetical protein ElyMa_000485900 [Elysia marginata]